jgi:hypothetical protein
MPLLLVGTGHLSLCFWRIVFMWVGLSNLLKVRETQCVLISHSLAPLLMMWGLGTGVVNSSQVACSVLTVIPQMDRKCNSDVL